MVEIMILLTPKHSFSFPPISISSGYFLIRLSKTQRTYDIFTFLCKENENEIVFYQKGYNSGEKPLIVYKNVQNSYSPKDPFQKQKTSNVTLYHT